MNICCKLSTEGLCLRVFNLFNQSVFAVSRFHSCDRWTRFILYISTRSAAVVFQKLYDLLCSVTVQHILPIFV